MSRVVLVPALSTLCLVFAASAVRQVHIDSH
jgi:hypothetical protein